MNIIGAKISPSARRIDTEKPWPLIRRAGLKLSPCGPVAIESQDVMCTVAAGRKFGKSSCKVSVIQNPTRGSTAAFFLDFGGKREMLVFACACRQSLQDTEV